MELTSYPRTPRLMNRFSLGADPEFVFHDTKGLYVYAENMGLNTRRGFGCDMAGRQAEIRAFPSRFALEVVASIVDSLRWMAYVHPELLSLKWIAPAFNGHDGCGGHIHFGRRRPNRDQEIKTLDATLKSLLSIGVFNTDKFASRKADKKHGYGLWGDIRLQAHGYEYRTISTELASPWLMYFVLVINKLTLMGGKLLKPGEDVVNLLKAFADRDDDAAIALQAFRVWGLPEETEKNFLPNWGINHLAGLIPPSLTRYFFPSTIRPEGQTCVEVFDYLVHGATLPKRTPKPTWEPFELPQDFFEVNVQNHTLGHLPDVGMNLVSRKVQVTLQIGADFRIMYSIPLPVARIKEALKLGLSDITFRLQRCSGIIIQVTSNFNKSREQCKLLHKVLSDSTLFPVCRATEIAHVDWARWDNVSPTIASAKLGRLLAKVQRKPREVKPELNQSNLMSRPEWEDHF
jgi:hypothetical protein